MHAKLHPSIVAAAVRLAVLAGGLLLLPACTSLDRHEFYSAVDLPKTVTVVDTNTQQVYWSKDVPAGYRLVLDLDHPDEVPFIQAGERPATRLKWTLYNSEDPIVGVWFKDPIEGGDMPLPGVPVLMKVAFRPAPEYPPGYNGPAVPREKPVDTQPAPVSKEVEIVPLPAPAPPAAPAK